MSATGHTGVRFADPDDPAAAERIAALLGLQPLQLEGGRFSQAYADEHATAIYYLLAAGERSALHRLSGPEIYHFYAGAPLRLLLLDETDGSVAEPLLGTDLPAGERPQLAVPAGVWQGSTTTGAWSLVGTTMAPPFDWAGFRLGERASLAARFPAAADRIGELSD